MSDFALGFYCAITILMIVVFSIMHARSPGKISVTESILTATAVLCWPILALAVAIATFVAWVKKK